MEQGRVWRCGVPALGSSATARTCRLVPLATQLVRPLCPALQSVICPADLTAAGLVLCGGESAATATSCISWAPGTSTWTTYATIQSRKAHMSWVTKTGQLYLLGGNRASGTLSSTEIVGVGPGFSLQRPTE